MEERDELHRRMKAGKSHGSQKISSPTFPVMVVGVVRASVVVVHAINGPAPPETAHGGSTCGVHLTGDGFVVGVR